MRLPVERNWVKMKLFRDARYYFGGPGAVGVMFLRLFTGLVFVMHGWGKVQKPFVWMNTHAAPASVPGVLQALAALAEFGGGFALIFGLLTPLACLGLMCDMLVACITLAHKHHDFLVPANGAIEPAACYFAIAFCLLLLGPGEFSLDAVLFGAGPFKGAGAGAKPPPRRR